MSNFGTLILPQLGEVNQSLTIELISRQDAEGLIKNFSERVAQSRRLKNYADAIEDAFFEVQAISPGTFFNDGDELTLLDRLSESKIVGLRGERAVFFETDNYNDEENAALLIGTAVVYNRNWATLGVVDTTVFETIENETYRQEDEDEDLDEEECDECPCGCGECY